MIQFINTEDILDDPRIHKNTKPLFQYVDKYSNLMCMGPIHKPGPTDKFVGYLFHHSFKYDSHCTGSKVKGGLNFKSQMFNHWIYQMCFHDFDNLVLKQGVDVRDVITAWWGVKSYYGWNKLYLFDFKL